MRITVDTRAAGPGGARRSLDLLAVPLAKLDPEGWRLPARLQALDRGLGGGLHRAVATGDFRGKRGETLLLYGDDDAGAQRVLLVGTGDESSLDAGVLREAAAIVAGAATRRRARRIAILAPSGRRVRAPAAVQALAEGLVLASYRFDRYRSSREGDPGEVETASIQVDGGAELRRLRQAAARGVHLAECQNLARDLSNEPPCDLPPAAMARAAQRVAKEVGLTCRVLGPAELKKRKMGAILAVGQGSANPPRLIVLEHNAPRRGATRGRRRTVCLVGKGVTFDSGGLSLKPSASMVPMKHDMSGAATVLATLRAAALLRIPHHVVGILGAAENMPSGTAYRPSDVVTTMSGKTVEISNTDAEGRLVLADAMHYAKTEYEPEVMVDVATLTGACAVALGTWAAAVLSNDERLSDAIRSAGESCSERFWPLPLWDVHREHMRGKVADVKQTGGRDGGTITAAAFLWHFAGETPWAHLDIASTADTEQTSPLQPAGATGFGVRTLAEFLRGYGKGR